MKKDQIQIGTDDAHVEWDRYEGLSVWIDGHRMQFHFWRDNYGDDRVWPPEWRRTHSTLIYHQGHEIDPPILIEKGRIVWFLHHVMSVTWKIKPTK